MIKHFLALLFFIIAKIVPAQVDTYTIHLKPEDWGLKPQAYFICGIEDKRHSSGNDGKVLSAASGKPISVKFENGMEKEIHSLLQAALLMIPVKFHFGSASMNSFLKTPERLQSIHFL
ncbi:MAG: hypothetical protein IPG90_12050 [Bacteroidetes bacterium]|nr:hypothetical protein [Bacteroidota bacterium]